jgi:hypothetical protein
VHSYVAGKGWQRRAFDLKELSPASLRFVDLDGDGRLDIVHSDEKGFAVLQFQNMVNGWKKVRSGKSGDDGTIPWIARAGTNNGAFAHSGHLWWANEDTPLLKNHVDRRGFKELLREK